MKPENSKALIHCPERIEICKFGAKKLQNAIAI